MAISRKLSPEPPTSNSWLIFFGVTSGHYLPHIWDNHWDINTICLHMECHYRKKVKGVIKLEKNLSTRGKLSFNK